MSNFIKCQCPGCMSEGTVKLSLNRRGGRPAYLCEFHARDVESYYRTNNNRHGKDKVNPWSVGWENETSNSTLKARVELGAANFIPTHDSSLGDNGVEFKSPIFQGLNAISKIAVSVERLMMDGDLEKNGDCGDHTHIGNRDHINPATMDYIRRFYHSLFIPLCKEMQLNPHATERMFGRYFTYYADTIDETSDATEHTNFINLQHDHTIEFRLTKFRSAAQYMNVVKFARACCEAIVNNFVLHFNDPIEDGETDKAKIKAYRKHKADVAAQKMVKLYRKYSADAPAWN